MDNTNAQELSMMEKMDLALHEKNVFNDQLEKVEAKLGVRRLYIVLASIVVLALYLMIGYGSSFLCNFLGFLYPAYSSVKAIESRNKDDDTKWLTYWVVYSMFSLIEMVTDIFLFWVPFYWFLKCVFLVYCMVGGQYNGSIFIYNRFLRPLTIRYQGEVDEVINQISEGTRKIINEADEIGVEVGANLVRQRFMQNE